MIAAPAVEREQQWRVWISSSLAENPNATSSDVFDDCSYFPAGSDQSAFKKLAALMIKEAHDARDPGGFIVADPKIDGTLKLPAQVAGPAPVATTPIEQAPLPTVSMLDWALDANRRGLSVFPCVPGGKEPASSDPRWSQVAPRGLLDATNDPEVIKRWWAINPNFNPAVNLGMSNKTCVDYDKCAPLLSTHGQTFGNKSGRINPVGRDGGYHDLYDGMTHTRNITVPPVLPLDEVEKKVKRGDKEVVVKILYDALDRKVIKGRAVVGEIRSAGAYIVWAGALHSSGRYYETLHDLPFLSWVENDEVKAISVTCDEAQGDIVPIASEELKKIATYIEAALGEANVVYKPRQVYRGGFRWLVDCPWDYLHDSATKLIKDGGSSCAVILNPNGSISFKCWHANCFEQNWKEDCRPYLEEQAGHRLQFGESAPVQIGTGLRMDEPDLDLYPDVSSEEHEGVPSNYDLSSEEYELELIKEYPVFPLKPQPGPEWSNDVLYGLAGDIVRKASQHNEAHPAGMLVDLLVSLGNMFGRTCYFNINATRHYSNEFMARVGDSSLSRKGGGRDEIDRLLKMVDGDWFRNRTVSGFGSAEAVIAQVKDEAISKRFDKRKKEFVDTVVPGVDDKRLFIREGELASVFLLASKSESRADVVIRDGWDGKPLRNLVKGQNADGINNSAFCEEPHISISGDTTRAELMMKMPDGADENGFGNRFLYTYVYRVQLCPLGGPEIDWTQEVIALCRVISFAQKQGCVGLTASAKTTWNRMYVDIENNHLPGLAGKMTARAAAHIRRLALILAMLDLSSSIDVKHLRAAERVWEYCKDSAQFIFSGTTKAQIKLLQWFRKQEQPVTLSQIRDDCYQRHEKADVIKERVAELVRLKHLKQIDDTYQIAETKSWV